MFDMKHALKAIFCFSIFTIFMSAQMDAETHSESTKPPISITTKLVEYSTKDLVMEGYLAYDESKSSPRPGILIVHDWMGLGAFAKSKADQLAKEGYIAFAADVYGKGLRPHNSDEAGEFATKLKENRDILRERIRAAFDELASMPDVNKNKIAVMGYCFGGTTALELARSGAPLAGTISFHGGLSSPTHEDAKNIQGPVLVLHGADDPFVSTSEVTDFKNAMERAGVNMKFIAYNGAVHAFTNPAAGNDNSKGAAYNARADQESWIEFEKFLKKIFNK